MCDDVIFVWDRVSTRPLGGGWGWGCYETITVVSICPLAALCIYIRVFNISRAELILHNRLTNVWTPSRYIILNPNVLCCSSDGAHVVHGLHLLVLSSAAPLDP